ncbi:MAG TPA: GPW/gp25 family protein [Allosphingosinicella sp.]|uniref:GPW/gp25 family protein n=1 Tax=Allosphingosinicella sp. TaxID=2823234 RepID=UPI002ED986EC
MLGMDASTGKPLGGRAHLVQSMRDILTTPIGTRVGRRDYGSLIPELIDQPMNPAGRLRLFAAAAIALTRWEPRFRLRRTELIRSTTVQGSYDLALEGEDLEAPGPNSRARLTIPLRPQGSLTAFA